MGQGERAGWGQSIDLAAHGVLVDFEGSETFTIPEAVGDQIQQAAAASGAIVKLRFSVSGIALPVQAYCSGSVVPAAHTYQLACRVWINAWLDLSFVLENSKTILHVNSVTGQGDEGWNTLLDTTLTEDVQAVSVSVPDTAKTVRISVKLSPSNNQSESGPMVTTICGSEIARWTTFVPTQDNVTSKSDYGTALIVLDVGAFRVVGIFSKGESAWTKEVIGADRSNGQEVRLHTWGTSYFGTGSIFLVEAM